MMNGTLKRKKGFIWKGIYIKVLASQNARNLKEEIKELQSLSVKFWELCSTFLNCDQEIVSLFLKNMLIPFLSMTEMLIIVLYGTVCIYSPDMIDSKLHIKSLVSKFINGIHGSQSNKKGFSSEESTGDKNNLNKTVTLMNSSNLFESINNEAINQFNSFIIKLNHSNLIPVSDSALYNSENDKLKYFLKSPWENFKKNDLKTGICCLIPSTTE